MARTLMCPDCGEDDRLDGVPTDDGIRTSCGACGATWLRDSAPRCATCGGGDIVLRPRPLTQFSRGTQLSIVGWIDVPCCAVCDAEALLASTSSGGPLPRDYRPAALHARQADEVD